MTPELKEEVARRIESALGKDLPKAGLAVLVLAVTVSATLLGVSMPQKVILGALAFLLMFGVWLYVRQFLFGVRLERIEANQRKDTAGYSPSTTLPHREPEVTEAMSSLLCLLCDSRPGPMTERELAAGSRTEIPDVEYSLRKLAKVGFVTEPKVQRVLPDSTAVCIYYILDPGVDYLKEKHLR